MTLSQCQSKLFIQRVVANVSLTLRVALNNYWQTLTWDMWVPYSYLQWVCWCRQNNGPTDGNATFTDKAWTTTATATTDITTSTASRQSTTTDTRQWQATWRTGQTTTWQRGAGRGGNDIVLLHQLKETRLIIVGQAWVNSWWCWFILTIPKLTNQSRLCCYCCVEPRVCKSHMVSTSAIIWIVWLGNQQWNFKLWKRSSRRVAFCYSV